MFKQKPCKMCNEIFQPKAPAGLYCESCQIIAKEALKERNSVSAYNSWVKNAIKNGREHTVGVGKGGSSKKGSEHKQYKNGIGSFQKELKPIVKATRYCNRCGKDLIDATNYQWAVHHIDHDRTHNTLDNLELLCKRCHQIEHECWKAFESATTISEESTPK